MPAAVRRTRSSVCQSTKTTSTGKGRIRTVARLDGSENPKSTPYPFAPGHRRPGRAVRRSEPPQEQATRLTTRSTLRGGASQNAFYYKPIRTCWAPG